MRDCMRRWCGAASALPQAAVPPGARSLRLFVGTRGAPSRLHRQDRWRRGDGRVPRSGRRGARGAVDAGRGGKLQSRAQRPGDEVEIGRVASSSPTCRARPSRTISSATSLRRSCSGQSRRRSRYPLPSRNLASARVSSQAIPRPRPIMRTGSFKPRSVALSAVTSRPASASRASGSASTASEMIASPPWH